jgi:hypothetical protein
MNEILKYIFWFVGLILAQTLIFGQIEFGLGLHIMIYPLFIILLPFDTKPIVLMLLAFGLGIILDSFSNTFGLHASASVILAYFRPELYRLFAPRDGYDLLMKPSIKDLGYRWFFSVSSILITLHHFWFFFLEYFKWSAWVTILQNTILSAIITLFIIMAVEILFTRKEKRI